MLDSRWVRAFLIVYLGTLRTAPSAAEDRVQRFDRDPGWDSHNNRAVEPRPRTIRQDFGYSRTAHAGGEIGEIGGFLSPAAEAAYYAKVIPETTFDRPLIASGKLATNGRPFHALIGFFNSGTINEWRTPNSIALRISGRGDVFYAWVEYATARWRAGGDEPRGFATRRNEVTGRAEPVGFSVKGAAHRWSLRYDPEANSGEGAITATIDDQTAVCHLQKGHKADGATFNRFGMINVIKSADAGGELWLDDLTINGIEERFDRDPSWNAFQNRRTYETANVRPRFDFESVNAIAAPSFAAQKRDLAEHLVDHGQLLVRCRQRLFRFTQLVDGLADSVVCLVDLGIGCCHAFLGDVQPLTGGRKLAICLDQLRLHVRKLPIGGDQLLIGHGQVSIRRVEVIESRIDATDHRSTRKGCESQADEANASCH